MADAAYVDRLAGELVQRHPDLLSAEQDLAILHGRLAIVTRFIHNPIHDRAAREALARDLQLPAPTKNRTST